MATRRCGEIEVGAVPHKQSQVKAVNTAEESRTLAGGFHPTQNGDKRGYDTSKEDAEKGDDVPVLKSTIAQLQARVRQLEEKIRDPETHDWLILEESRDEMMREFMYGADASDRNGDVSATKDQLIERQWLAIRELKTKIETLKEKEAGNPILELFTGRRYSDMEVQLANMEEKLEHFRMNDSQQKKEIATLKSQLEAAQLMEADRAMRQVEATLRKGVIEERLVNDCELTCRGRPDRQSDTNENKLLEEIEALKQDRKQLQQETIALKDEMRRRSLSHSNKTGQKEGKNDLKQSQVQIDRLENQVQELKKKLDVERSQSQAFSEDFAKERQDRINAITKLNRLEEELKSVQLKLDATESELERHKTILEDTETIAARNTKQLTSELEATKAEISVKVAQVKQYQKQVEMYKLQVNKDGAQVESQLTPPATTHTSGGEMCTKCFVPLASESTDKARAAMVVEASDRTERGTQTDLEDYASGNLATSQPQTCLFEISCCDVSDLPPPILQTELFIRESTILASTNQQLCASIDDGSDLPPPIHLYPLSGQLCDLGEESTNNLVRDLEVEMQCEAEKVRALEKCKDRPTQHEIPLDFNLKCPTCNKVFRKGQIQRFRGHVSNCKGVDKGGQGVL